MREEVLSLKYERRQKVRKLNLRLTPNAKQFWNLVNMRMDRASGI